VLSYKDNLEKGAEEHFENFSKLINDQVKTLATHTAAQEDAISKQVSSLIVEAKEEIDRYKKSRLENIDEAVADLIERVSKDILNRTIRIEEHEDLVWKALESAKNEGIFELDGLNVNRKPGVMAASGEVKNDRA
jgi:F0F1-type ATP synthase membrane subunit b/b'